MKKHLVLSALAGALVVTPTLAQTAPPATINVTGQASISVPPDLAVIDGGVGSDAKTAREAADSNNSAMARVLTALKGAGIADKDVQTSRLSLQAQYAQQSSSRPGVNVISGYHASNRVTIRLRDVTKVASTLDTLVSAGANDIGGINFTVAEPSKLLDDARSKAIADARRKAEIYAAAAGVTLGAPVSISEEGSSAPMPMAFRKMNAVVAPAPIAQGEETLQITVSVAWAIKPAQ
jgi:uncharacterized protein YggE